MAPEDGVEPRQLGLEKAAAARRKLARVGTRARASRARRERRRAQGGYGRGGGRGRRSGRGAEERRRRHARGGQERDRDSDQGERSATRFLLLLEGLSERSRVGEPSRRQRSERSIDRAREARGNVAALLFQRDEVARRGHSDHGGRVVGLERVATREALVEDRAEREDVGGRPGVTRVAHLLGRPCSRRSPCARPSSRARCSRSRPPTSSLKCFASPRSATSGARPSVRVKTEHVLGLEVAVDDPLLVRAPRWRGRARSRASRASSTASGPRSSSSRSVPPVDERHDEEGPARRVAGVEERDEPLLLAERREEPLLPLEAGSRVGLLRVEDELDRDVAPVGRARARTTPMPPRPISPTIV